MSQFEAQQIIAEYAALATEQFQFWMAATFAVVIASYSVGDRLAPWARTVVAALYALAVAQFFLRIVALLADIGDTASQLPAVVVSGSGPDPITRWSLILQFAVMLGGSILAIVLVLWPAIGMRRKLDASCE